MSEAGKPGPPAGPAPELSREQLDALIRRLQQRKAQRGGAEVRPDGGERPERPGSAGRIPRRPAGGAAPLSFAQERLWFLAELEPESAAYNIPAAVRLTGELDRPALARALGEIVRRHEVLRTAILRQEGGRPVQAVRPASPPGAALELPIIDLSGLPREKAEEALPAAASTEAATPFDLAAGAPLRARLVRLDQAGPAEHALLLTIHHIAADGWSMGVLVGELAALYGAFRAGRLLPVTALPELAIQYADYAVWQRSQLAGAALDRLLGWWRERLAGAPPVLELPADRPRPAVQSGRGGQVPVALAPDLVRALADSGRRPAHGPNGGGATLFMTLLAGWQALLLRLTGREDLVVGTAVANRNRPETEPLIGLLVNTLPLRTGLDGDPAFREAVARVRETVAGAWAHQELPFERLVEALAPQRSSSHAPLVQVVLSLQGAPLPPLALPGLAAMRLEVERATAKFDLTLELEARGEGLAGWIEFNRDLFDAATPARWAGHLATLLAAAAADPAAALSDLPLLSPAEQAQLLEEWNDTTWVQGAPSLSSVPQRILEQARLRPAKVAVSWPGDQLTFGELVAQAGRLAARLRGLGVGPEVRVGLCTGRTVERVVGGLAVWLAGGAYVALDSSYPPERLRWLVENAAAPVVLADRLGAGRLPGTGAAVLVLDCAEDTTPAAEEAGIAPPAPDPAHLALMIYTSGSTGRPKGVGIPHAGLSHLADWFIGGFAAEPGDRSIQTSSPAFDASVLETWPCLAAGGTVTLPDDVSRLEPAATLRWLDDQAITLVFLTTPLTEALLAELERRPQAAAGLRVRGVFAGGDRLHRRPTPGLPFPVWNFYGPTEITVLVTAGAVEPGESRDGNPSIGRPIARARAVVVDRWGRPAPVGAPGELWIGGAGLARGYLGWPDLTAERFVPDPFSREPGARLYRTGDLVRRLPDGRLDFLGRIDHQIKLRGLRIEPGEIEATLARHPAVGQTAVLVMGDRLVAAVSAPGPARPGLVEMLRADLRAELPEFMVPALILVLPELPLTPNGKVDREALAGLAEQGLREGSGGGTAPRDAVEERLAGLFRELLGVERVAVEDGFFDLGGHSLLATQLRSRVRADLGVDLPLRRFFEAPTVAGLAAAVRAAAPEGDAPPPPVPAGDEVLSYAQERMWFLDRLDPGSPAYNVAVAVQAEGALDAAALAAAFAALVRRHEPLRSRFPEWGGKATVALASPAALAADPAPPLPAVDLAGLPDGARFAAAEALGREEAARPFDLAAGPLLRTTLLRLGPGAHRLLLVFHHIAADGWSAGILVRELAAFYAAAIGREAGSAAVPDGGLAPLAVRYADFARWQRAHLQSGALAGQLAYWRERLAGVPVLRLPTDRPRPPVRRQRGASLDVALPLDLAAALADLARREGATLFMVLLAGFQAVLGRWSGQADFALGSPVANRNRAWTEGLIGLFVNTLALRSDLGAAGSGRELLALCRRTCLEAYDHQDLPFEQLVEELAPERDASFTPLVQVLLSLLNVPAGPLALPGLTLTSEALPSPAARFDLTLSLGEREGGVAGQLEYDRDLFDAATAGRLSAHLAVLLAALAEAPEQPVAGLPLLAPAEARELLAWSRGALDGPAAPPPLAAAFAARAAAAPEAVAIEVLDGGRRWTFGDLEAASNRLARRLLGAGVGPWTRVGLGLDRCPELVLAALAVIKAGGAYVPLDPAQPPVRLARMAEDGRLALLLTVERLAPGLPELPGVPRLVLDAPECRADLARFSAAPFGAQAGPDDLLYVIFTSGSTGQPKGAGVTRGAFDRLLGWYAGEFGFGPDDAMLVLSSPSFDLTQKSLFAPLLAGGRLLLGPEPYDPQLLAEAVARRGATRINCTPSAFHPLLDAGGPGGLAPLRTVFLGGEPISPARLAPWRRHPACRGEVVNTYGPTECTDVVAFHRLPPAGAEEGGPVPIGRPLPGLFLAVLDPVWGLQPAGVPGQLAVGGPAVGAGYLGDPALTASRFVPDPFAGRGAPGARLYLTGDLARWRPAAEGSAPVLEYLRRIDHQVKVRGFRIELGEVEAALAACPGVREAAAVVHGDRLVGFVASADRRPAEDLRDLLRQRLPDFMLPAAVIALPELPLSPNGKLDRRALAALAAPTSAQAAAARSEAGPAGGAEERLARLFGEVLGLPEGAGVGTAESFFDLGGHSLLATQLQSRVRDAFGVHLPLRRFFEAPTPAGLARLLREAAVREALGPLPPSLPDGTETGERPLSFAQERMWFLGVLDPGSAVYNISLAVRATGVLDPAALAAAFAAVAERHEPLRSRFPEAAEADGRAVLEIAPRLAPDLPVVDLAGLPADRREAAAQELGKEELARPFDLAAGPLLRTTLLRFAAAEHLLLCTVHHIAADGWSVALLVRELAASYGALVHGREAALPALPVRYSDFARWQRAELVGGALAGQAAFWRERLAGLPVLRLPTDRPRPPRRAQRGSSLEVGWPVESVAALAGLARREGATLFMVLLAGFQAVLGRWAGQRDFAVGTPVANRTRTWSEGLIGLFVNTLALRSDLERGEGAEGGSGRGLLARARRTCLEAYEHQDLPFERLIEELAPERDPSFTPLVQVLLTLQNAPLAPLALPGLTLTPVFLPSPGARFDLTLSLEERAGASADGSGMAGILEYDRDLFDAATAARLVGHLETLLGGLAADPGRRVDELPLLTAAEQAQMMRWEGEDEESAPLWLAEAFARRVVADPGAVALAAGECRWTFEDLGKRAGQLSGLLAAAGVGPWTRVGLGLDRCPEFVVAALAVARAGGAYVPLDPTQPAARLGRMAADAGLAVLLTVERLALRLPEIPGVRRIVLDGEDREEIERAAPLEAAAGGPDDLLYVIYTSGSTGQPKGAGVTRRGFANLLGWYAGAFGFGPEDRVLVFSAVGFDLTQKTLFAPLVTGGRLLLAPEPYDPEALAATVAAEGVTRINCTPSAFYPLLEGSGGLERLASLRSVFLGGEPIAAARLVDWRRHPTCRAEVVNTYGPTECSDVVACHRLEPPAAGAGDDRPVPLGRPVPGARLLVLDRALGTLPAGVPGQLAVAGVPVGAGYLGDPALTADRFRPDVGATRPSPGRLYLTGDLARRRPDGLLEYLGRIDHQVKVRGFRVELGEIEAALAGCPGVREGVAAVRGAGDAARLVAYAVPAEDTPLDPAALRAHLAAALPDFMVPGTSMVLDALPLSPNGKVDRGALPEPPDAAAGAAAPRTELEELLCGLFADVLGRARVGVEESFFDLGGHSLLATRLAARIRAACGVEVPLRSLFELPTVAALARLVARGLTAAADGGAATPPLVPCSHEVAELPLSYGQERLWILDRFEPGSAAYNIPAAVRFRGRLDPGALARSLAAVVARQGALRTGYRSVDGRPVQVVAPEMPFGLGVADLAGLAPGMRERELARLAAADAAAPFDLTRPPLLRAALLALGNAAEPAPAGDWVLLLCLHHIAGDGWSLGVLVTEVTRLYEALVAGTAPNLPALPVQYADYAVWQRRHLGPAALAGQLAYWRGQLAGLPPSLELPTDRPRPAVRSFRGDRRTLHLGGELAGRLRQVARGAGATPFMVLLAGFAALLGRLAGEGDLAVGTPVAGRGRTELEPLIGMFLNTLVLRLDVTADAGGPGFAGLVARVRETALAAYAHQDVPFEMLLDDLQPARDLSRTPLFQVFFNLLNFPLPELRLPDLALESWEAPETPSKFDLTAYLVPEGESFRVELVYNADLFDRGRIDEMLAQYRLFLEQAAAEPGRPVVALSLLTPGAAAVLPDPAAPLDAAWVGSVGELVSARAAAAPGRPAVRSQAEGRAWTYAELEAQSNRLAHRLLGLGLARGAPVAVWAHRSAALTWTVLGILKAGGAFLLLDPAYPAARQVEILGLARPASWLQLEAAGAPPAEVAAWLDGALPAARRLVLPPWGSGRDALAGEPDVPPEVALGPGDLAYLAFTSGSSGVPKGILGLHGPLTHFLPWMAERYGFGPDDRFSLLSALSHDPLQRDLFTPLCLGGAVCIPDPREMMAAGALAAWMRRERVTVANLTPAMAQVITEAPEDGGLPDLRLVFLVGDVLTRWIVARLRRLAPAVTCVNHYGSTETQRAVGYHVLPPPEARTARSEARPDKRSEARSDREDVRSNQILPLGRGIPDVQLLVLAPGGRAPRRAGVGEVGEIAVRSPHVAGGYLGDEELTRARFRINPFTGAPGDRVYLTGDLGRYLPDGEVTFAGRADQQVKVRGFRIELGEIEGRLCRLPGVREAAVLARGEGAERRLAAYVVPERRDGVTAEALRARLKEQLPAYMVPTDFVLLDRLPLTPNGKLDRRALALQHPRQDARSTGGQETEMSYKAPESDTEQTIAAILQEALGREQVGVDDNFFDLGGNSLLLVQVHSRLQQALGREIQVVDLFNNPTVAALARHLALAGDGDGSGAAPAAAAPAVDRSEKLHQGRNRLRRRLEQRQRA